MAEKFANIIIDISHEKVDRTFQYKIPEYLEEQIFAGIRVWAPFGMGNHLRQGYVVEVTDQAEYDIEKMKAIEGIVPGSVTAESRLIQLAWWMRERYGSTMNQALKTVLPVKKTMKAVEKKTLVCLLEKEELEKELQEALRKHFKARARVLSLFSAEKRISYEKALKMGNITGAVLKPLLEKNILALESEIQYRNPVGSQREKAENICLNQEQQAAADAFAKDYKAGQRNTYLLYGITGSGKTEVYMEMMDLVLKTGKQVIVLIPEIALTFQTVIRFYNRFGQKIAIVNSRLSQGERFDQFERARKGEAQIMIGPRSALFTPFPQVGLIVIDEEQEGAYKSETAPRYDAREAALARARMEGASVVLGSATPSVESFEKAASGAYKLLRLRNRAKKESVLAKVWVADMREELKAGNKTVFSRQLQKLLEETLQKREQAILFLNRRGYSSFISCRSCGEAIKCPNCDVSLTSHKDGKMRCHYCGHEEPLPEKCPSCGSPYIAGFGTGTQKVEEITKKMFPAARVLRMDMDTTSGKKGHEEILSAFRSGEADILIGTQMIVKGHDFPNVTLVGALAADMSLHAPDFRAGERTFQLLTQAAGRAGRDSRPGYVVIQTYLPEHYAIQTAAVQDYEAFFAQERAYRRLLHYPPFCGVVAVAVAAADQQILESAANELAEEAKLQSEMWKNLREQRQGFEIEIMGPVQASVYKVNNLYRKILYIKNENYDILIKIRTKLEVCAEKAQWRQDVQLQWDVS